MNINYISNEYRHFSNKQYLQVVSNIDRIKCITKLIIKIYRLISERSYTPMYIHIVYGFINT